MRLTYLICTYRSVGSCRLEELAVSICVHDEDNRYTWRGISRRGGVH